MKPFASLFIFFLFCVTASAQLTTTTLAGTVGILALPGVKGAPFSAEVITEIERILPDGNHIRQEYPGKVFRDSEGRVRRETLQKNADGNEFTTININDPVRQVSIHFSDLTGDVATLFTHPNPTLKLTSPATAPAAQPHPVGPGANSSGQPALSNTRVKPENLGDKTIEGYAVHGTRRTQTIAAGAIGNEQPIVKTIESWYSKELHADLLTEVVDPQTSHRTTRLLNIRPGEPDPSLFQIPANFKIKEVETVVKEVSTEP